MDESLEQLVQSVLESPKYLHLHIGLVRRIARNELVKRGKYKAALKATRSKLHQVGGAYFPSKIRKEEYPVWLGHLRESANDQEKIMHHCREIMARHASTKERLPILDHYYSRIMDDLPPIRSVIDVGCGLNPLAIPWMGLAQGASYYACDIYLDIMDFIQEALDFFPVQGSAEARDVIADPPTEPADLALVLKTLPCLEQLERRAGEVLLDRLNTRYMLVSFPARSLGGRKKGMQKNYGEFFESLVRDKAWAIKRFDFTNEIAYFITKGA